MSTIPATQSAPEARRRSLARVPQLTAWVALMSVSEIVHFVGCMTLLAAMCVEVGVRGVINHKEA